MFIFPEFRCYRIIGWLAAALALLLLPACSSVRLAYNNAPELTYWWLDSYVEFDDGQSTRVHAELAQLLAWHRSNELPRTAELLHKLQPLAAAAITPAQACSAYADIRTHLQPLFAKAEAPAAEVALSFSAAQLQHLEQRLRKNNVDYLEKWGQGSPQERQARHLKTSVERYENLYGTLEDGQLAALQASIAASSYDFDRAFAERRRRQQDLLQTLRHISTVKPTAAQTQALLRALLERSLDAAPAGRQAYPYRERMTQEACETFAAVHNAATPAQRERAVRRLVAYERDARELAGQR